MGEYYYVSGNLQGMKDEKYLEIHALLTYNYCILA